MITEVSKGRDTTVPCFCGLSTDSKPTDAGNGAEFREIDTGDIYYFNEAGSTWVKWTGSGGGGGSSDLSTATVTFIVTDEGSSHLEVYCSDSDTGEIYGLWQSAEGFFNEMIGDNVDGGDSATYTFLIANGKHLTAWAESGDGNYTVNGDAEVDDSNVIITGDCTISVVGSN